MITKIFTKFFNLFLGYPLYLFSFFIPRNQKKIVVGSHTPFNDNSKYFFLFSHKYLNDYKIIWLTNDTNVVKIVNNLGMESCKVRTLKGIFHALTAKYYIYSFHLHDINFWTSGGSTKFNLWHGIPLKDIAFAIKSGPSAKLYDEQILFSRLMRPHIFVRPNYMVTTSKLMSSYFSKAFRIQKKQCLEFGMPRCEILSWDNDKIIKFVDTYESSKMLTFIHQLEKYKKVFIYMPTWREEVDFLNNAGFNFEVLNERLKKDNMLFLFKLHPFTKLKNINLNEINTYSNLLVMDTEMDIYPILPFTDCLITDYSSIYYDYLLCKEKEIYLYPFDYDHYVSNNRDLAFDYKTHMPGLHLKNFDDLLNVLKYSDHKFLEDQKKIKEEYFSENSQNSVKQLCKFIEGI